MNNSYNTQSAALLDENFLATLSQHRERDIYAKIIALDINENPIDSIEGKVTGGSINIDGSSTIRRTCNLTMISKNIDINDYYWGIKTKFKLEIGLRNKLTGEYAPVQGSIYPEIVWFPQGYYIISAFNTSISTNSCSISLTGKDKMCLLNGDLGGQLFASIDFGTEETKIKKVDQVILDTYPSSSEGITLKDYYIKIENSEDDAILSNDPRYWFVLNEDGEYYKNENFYYKKKLDTKNNNLKYYDAYKKIDTPDDLFEPLEEGYKYVPNTYYYNKFYRETSQTPILNRVYFQKFNNTYEQKGKLESFTSGGEYYYSDYFVLDVADTQSYEDRNYYKLVPLYEVYEDTIKEKIPIEKIIREAVHTYAKEPYYNIIINDLENYGLEQLTYKGDKTLYALYDNDKGEFTNLFLEGTNNSLDDIINDSKNKFQFYSSEDEDYGTGLLLDRDEKIFSLAGDNNTNVYYIMKIEYGQDVGYRVTNLVYPGDLISSIGDSLTSVLDKIKSMFDDFEYFYDIDGRFVFQKKKTYVNTVWSQIANNQDEQFVDYANSKNKFSFNFEGNRLISAIQNTPALNNVKNDFIVWGKRKGISGADIPIHARYAIDKKPVFYQSLQGKIYTVDQQYLIEQKVFTEIQTEQTLENHQVYIVDWREIIYQMALDYFAGQGCSEKEPLYIKKYGTTEDSWVAMTDPDHFLYEVGRRNPYYYPTGYTGYEQYYTDMQGFWRKIYDPDYIPTPKYELGKYEIENKSDDNTATNGIYTKVKTWKTNTIVDYNIEYYISNTKEAIIKQISQNPQLSDTNNDLYKKYQSFLYDSNNEEDDSKKSRRYWNRNVFEAPETLDFWIEFLDSGTELQQFSVTQIGDRTKVLNYDKQTAILYTEIPGFVFYDSSNQEQSDNDIKENLALIIPEYFSGYRFIRLPKGFSQFFTISYRATSLKDKIDELLYQYSYCTENINITSVPIYYLQPNTRIYVQDKDTNIDGEYIINKITLPLSFNGTMSISAIKAPQRLY